MFDRLIKLIGIDKFKEIQSKKILLIGVGGVGSYSLESLIRNGFINITIVDFDKIDITNLNRQLITNQNNIGLNKVDEAIKRAKSINKDINIKGLNIKLDKDNIKELLDNNYDYIIDACDDIDVKVQLMYYSMKYNYKLISSMGTAKKNDPTKLSITTLDKTNYDPLAKIIRKKIRDLKINKKIYVVSSTEAPVNSNFLGSNNLVPSVAGLLCVSYIYNDILNQ